MSGPRTARHDLLPLFNVINHIPAILQCLLFLAHDYHIQDQYEVCFERQNIQDCSNGLMGDPGGFWATN